MSKPDFTAYRRHLPHRHGPESLLFLTWRLQDSLPAKVVARMEQKRKAWIEQHPKPWSPETEYDFHRLFSRRIDRWLDRGLGSCVLRNPACAGIVADAFHYFDSIRYDLDTYVVMPNHVHVLLQLKPEWTLQSILHSLKSYTASEINKHTNQQGSLWQQEVWDRIVRSPAHLNKCREYIRNNPAKAHLREGEYLLYCKKQTEVGLPRPT